MRTMIFYSLTDAEIADPRLTAHGLRDVKRHGFDSIYIEFRQTKAPIDAPRRQQAVARVSREAKRIGLQTIVAADSRNMRGELLRHQPDAFSDDLMPVWVEVDGGAFTLETPGEILHRHVAGAWRIDAPANGRAVRATDVLKKLSPGEAIAEGGMCAMTRPQPPMLVRQRFTVKGMTSGRLFLAVRYAHRYEAIDLGHPAVPKANREQLDLMKGLPLAGYAWDEPGYGFAFYPNEGRAISARILTEFKKLFGYDLAPRVVDLWFDRAGANPPSAMVRLHYAEVLERGLNRIEKAFKRDAARRHGGPVTIGIHRTMHEETSDDVYFGSSDYFRHNANTSDGFTDSIFHREDSMLCMLQLARSMAVVSDGKRAFNNSWGFFPTNEQLDYYTSAMALLNVRWIGHLYHGSSKFGPGYPDHPTWAGMKPRMDRLARATARLDGARPNAATAIVYNWRALNQYAGNYLHAHRSGLMLLAKDMTLANVQFQFVSPELLAASRAKQDGSFAGPAGAFRRLIVPWPDLMPPKAWTAIEALKAAGVEIIFYGPPPALDAEGGDASARFAALCGIKKLDAHGYGEAGEGARLVMGGGAFSADPEKAEPKFYNAPERTYPKAWRWWNLAPTRGCEAVGTLGKASVAVQSGPVMYVAAEAPLFNGWTAAVAAGGVGIDVPSGALVAKHTRGGETLWTVLGRWNAPVKGAISLDGNAVDINGAEFAIVTRRETGRVAVERFKPLISV